MFIPGSIRFPVSRKTNLPDEHLKRDLHIQADLDNPAVSGERLHIDQNIETPEQIHRNNRAHPVHLLFSTNQFENSGWPEQQEPDPGFTGIYALRSGHRKKTALGRGGGSADTESAVEAALDWLKRHQAPDGSWSMVISV